jgi:hypothetical protein
VTAVVVFLGPTMSHDEERSVLAATYLPPAGYGDVLRAALRRPRAIAIVDGVFERGPAIWHKEILFALSEGIHVFGAASMGALRAAELDRFGMRGIGEVYRAYVEGVLEDDDEVAVAHADAEHGFRALSDALVDVRATLDAAVSSGIVSDRAAATIVARVERTFYPERSLLGVLDRQDEQHERLRAWLPEGWVRRKHDDALALLRAVGDALEAGLEPFRPDWTLQRTCWWEDALRSVELAAEPSAGAIPLSTADEELEAVLDEIRLDPDRHRRLLDRALAAALALRAAASGGVDVSSWSHRAALDGERRIRGLLEPEDVDAWLEERGLAAADLSPIARRLAVLRWAREAHRDAVAGEVVLTVRLDEDYPALAARAARKREVRGSMAAGRAGGIAGIGGVDDTELVSWYFRERLGREVPVALDEWASAHGWRGAEELVRAIGAEWWFGKSSRAELAGD